VRRTGDIGLFRIVSETGIASGVRRIEAVTGRGALAYVAEQSQRLARIAQLVKGGPDDVEDKVQQLVSRVRSLEKDMMQLKDMLASRQGGELASQAREIGGVKVLAARLDGADAKSLRGTLDQLKDKLGSAVIVLGAAGDGKATLIVGVTGDLGGRVHAGKLVGELARHLDGKGGGRPDMAQAGGPNADGLDAALEDAYTLSEKLLG
jgi:alanyl-tRNA synthetase